MYNLENLKQRKAYILDYKKYSKFAVLIPLVEINQEEHLLFEIRSRKLKIQPGEICFPGGKVESKDRNEKEGALRETSEELGITTEEISLYGPLDILVTPFNTLIYPYVGRIKDYRKIKPNLNEVEEVFYAPLRFFQKNKPKIYFNKIITIPPDNFPFELIPEGKNYEWRQGYYPVHFYNYKGKIIWGMTARILTNFISIISCK